MKKAFFSVISIVGLLVLLAIQAQATLIEMDWKTTNDKMITVDDTGLEWLDVRQSAGLSIKEVSGQLGTGGLFEGFRYAEISEVRGLFNSAGIPDMYINTGSFHLEILVQVEALITKWDADLSAAGIYGHMYNNASEVGKLGEERHRASYLELRGNGMAETENDYLFGTDKQDITYGSALVRSIPDASIMWLLGPSFICLGLLGRRKSKKS